MTELLDYSELQNVSYMEQQSTFYLDGKYVNLPPNCIVETYYDKENYKYYYRFLMLTNIHDENTESETMQVAVYTINENKSVYIMPYSDGTYVKINRRDFMRRLFQYYISMINDKDRFLIYRPWLVHDFLPAYTTLRLRVKTGEDSYVNIPYSSSNNSPIIAIYDSDDKQVYCSAYKYMSGGKEQIYNYISSSISLPINTFAPGKYTIKVLRCGFGLLDLVGGGYTKVFEIPKADRYKNPDGSYNPANNTSKWINQPYNDIYLDFNGEYLDFEIIPVISTCSQTELPGFTKFTWTPPEYQDVKQQVEDIYKLWGGIYENRTYEYDQYLHDFFTSFGTSLELEEKICPIYTCNFDVIASVHKGEEIENRGKVSFNHNVTYLNGNAAAYTALGDDYDPKTFVSETNQGWDLELSILHGSDYLASVGSTSFSSYYYNDLECPHILSTTYSEIYGGSYPSAVAGGGYYNVSAKMLSAAAVSQKRISYIKDEKGTTSSINIPCLSINAQYEYDQLIVTGGYGVGQNEFYGVGDAKIYSTPQENIDNRLNKYKVYKEQAINAYNNSLNNNQFEHCTSQNGMKFDVPIALVLGLIPEEKLYVKVNNYDFKGLSNFFTIEHSDEVGNKGMTFYDAFKEMKRHKIKSFKVPKVMEGSIDYTGYEQCEDYRNWIGGKIYRPSVIDIDLSEIPMR